MQEMYGDTGAGQNSPLVNKREESKRHKTRVREYLQKVLSYNAGKKGEEVIQKRYFGVFNVFQEIAYSVENFHIHDFSKIS